MRSDRWKQIDAILDSAMSISADRRSAFLDDACRDDPSLRAEIESLLNHESGIDSFMEDSAMRVLGQELAVNGSGVSRVWLVNRVFGTYAIERLLGSGGMADVYLAHDRKLNRPVAFKVLQPEFVRDPDRVHRFEREARAISALNHPNIVTIFDVGETDGCHFIATELVEGKNLRELIGRLRLEQILSIVCQVADALDAAHRKRLIHRDIKPENVMVREDGYAKVLDFGLVKLTEPAIDREGKHSVTDAGMLLGTLAYMSPEQVSGDQVDHRTDLWSLGVVLYEMLAGTNPFKAERRHSTLKKILEDEPTPLSEVDPSLPRELDAILRKALEKDVSLSYQSAADFNSDVKRCLRNIDSGAVSISRDSSPLRRADRRPRWLIPVIGLVLIAATAGFGTVFFGGEIWNGSTGEESKWNSGAVSRLTDFPGEENFPSLSSDGKILLYSREVDGNTDIYWQRVSGGDPRNLTADSAAVDTQPAFSPDGEQIAFRSSRDGGGIFVMGATGESVRRLTDFGFNPAWSPNGDEVAFTTIGFQNPHSRGPGVSELWIADVRTGATRRIETHIDAMGAAFSPGGDRIAVWSNDKKYQRDIWTVDARSGLAVRVTDDSAVDWNPVWSPDGKFIYFVSNRNGGHGVWRSSVDERTGVASGEPEAVLPPLTQSWMFALSRDGQSLAYISRQRIENLRAVAFDPLRSKIDGEPLIVTEGTRIIRSPDVSPDGASLVYYMHTPLGQADLVISNVDGSRERFLTTDAARDRIPRFSPDGRRVIYYSDAGGNYEIWSVNVDGSDRRTLISREGQALCYPFWSPDGQKIAYSFIGGPTFIIDANKPVHEQVPQELPPISEGVRFIAWSWSPDGKHLAGDAPGKPGQRSIYVYTFETNRYEKIADAGAEPIWLADSKRVMILDDGKLFMIDTSDHRLTEIFAQKPWDISTAAISPDNKRIYYTLLSIESDIQLLSQR